MVCYNAEKTIANVLSRIPETILAHPLLDTEILVIDDRSQDSTFETTLEHSLKFDGAPVTVLQNPCNLGYGGNQKVGYHYALKKNFDFVALIHGDAQYAPEELPRLLKPLLYNEADAVFGSRMLQPGGALEGGMPTYKYWGNRILTTIQNTVLGTQLSEFHSGYRLYSCQALRQLPFMLNSDDFDFDTDIIVQLHAAGLKLREIPIPTFYGDERCHVNGFSYGLKVVLSVISYRLQSLGIFYNRKFDIVSANQHYEPKYHFYSSHSLALNSVYFGSEILVLGCGPTNLVRPFIEKGCKVSALDQEVDSELRFVCQDTVKGDVDHLDVEKQFPGRNFDQVLALDIIEHLREPEAFLHKLRQAYSSGKTEIIITTGNIAFLPLRLMLLIGFFNYGKRGILDRTHTRLFTFGSLRQMLQQYGFEVLECKGIPAPIPLALGNTWLSNFILQANRFLIALHKGLFSYQLFFRVRAIPTTEVLLERAITHSANAMDLRERKQNSTVVH